MKQIQNFNQNRCKKLSIMGRILCNEAMLESGKQVKWICKRICRQTTQTTFGSKCTSNRYQLFKVVVFGTNFFLRLRMRALLCSTNCFACSKPVRGVLKGGPRGPGPLNFGNKELYFSIVVLDVILGPLRPERSTYDSVLVSLYFWK